MNNEEKILSILQEMSGRITGIEDRMTGIEDRIDRIECDISTIKEDVVEIKEEAAITRVGTDRLIEWAERVEPVTKVRLVP